MRKLTERTKYDYAPDGSALIYARRKDNNKWGAVFACHASVIPLILDKRMTLKEAANLALLRAPQA